MPDKMQRDNMYSPVIGELPPYLVALKLREMGDVYTALNIENSINMLNSRDIPTGANMHSMSADMKTFSQDESGLFTGWGWPFDKNPAPYMCTSHAFGFIPAGSKANKNGSIEIKHAGNIEPDTSLKNSRIKITLDRLRVAKYPGSGMHNILFDFSAQNQLKENAENLHFNQMYRAQEGQQVGLINYPIFIGLNVGANGVDFKCDTVNVKNDNDEAILNFLDSDPFKAGLKLVNTAQPAIAPLTGLAVGLTTMIAKRTQNVRVQSISMGLDFSSVPTGARLAEGSYIAVQVCDESKWNWDEWVFNLNSGQIVNKADPGKMVPWNYLVFGVQKYQDS